MLELKIYHFLLMMEINKQILKDINLVIDDKNLQ